MTTDTLADKPLHWRVAFVQEMWRLHDAAQAEMDGWVHRALVQVAVSKYRRGEYPP